MHSRLNLVEAGEKMGLQITVLLADIIYVEVLQSTVPVFDSLGTFDLFFVFSTKTHLQYIKRIKETLH